MSAGDKKHLLERLKGSHLAIRGILKGADLEMRVYTETGWRIRDILGHIATWDLEVANSLRAFSAGSEYSTPGVDGMKPNSTSRQYLGSASCRSKKSVRNGNRRARAFQMLSVRFRWINFPLIYSTPKVTYLEPSTEAEQFLDMLRLAPAGRHILAELSSSKMEVQDGLNSSS